MHGDLSTAYRQARDNILGPLEQQGRVSLDRDGNDRTAAMVQWQDEAARSAFGANVAAIPPYEPGGFQVISASASSGQVELTIRGGMAWADGLLAYANDNSNFTATPLGAPPTGFRVGDRDVVILELWRESLSAFQYPDRLLEPALGGPDTAARLRTAFCLRVARLDGAETCTTVLNRLADDSTTLGALTVTLTPTMTVPSDCPETLAGGYTGFEHDLYRIEIARLSPGIPPMFKWSTNNGGLVGRGRMETGQVVITANDQSILRSGLDAFYLEIVSEDPHVPGTWLSVYGAPATLLPEGRLALGTAPLLGSAPPTGDFFFRLWDGILKLEDFSSASAPELRDGIHLGFAPPDPVTARYRPGDYWTFAVRAAGLANPGTLIDAQPPEGIRFHRVPLAEIEWTKESNAPVIYDCRVLLEPKGERRSCCSYTVGASGADFTLIQAAVDALPSDGGCICVLAGEYAESVTVSGKDNVTIRGCGERTIVRELRASDIVSDSDAVFRVSSVTNLRLESLSIIADSMPCVLLDQANVDPPREPMVPLPQARPWSRVELLELSLHADRYSAIEVRPGQDLRIARCRVRMADSAGAWPAVTIRATDVVIEHNRLEAPADGDAHKALGGLWLQGGCARVLVRSNEISGGRGIGILLGDIVTRDGPQTLRGPGWVYEHDDDCVGCLPGEGEVPPGPWKAGSSLQDLVIEENEIRGMGLAGIGVYGFFRDPARGIIQLARALFRQNAISECVRRRLQDVPEGMPSKMGFGAIVLAAARDVAIIDNRIAANGVEQVAPMCGVYVLLAEGLQILRNSIVGNGPREPRSPLGARAGIYIQYGISPASTDSLAPDSGALAIADNLIACKVGPALRAVALGPMAVERNDLSVTAGVPTDVFPCVWLVDLGADSSAQPLTFAQFGGAAPSAASPPPPPAGPLSFTHNQVRLHSTQKLPSALAAVGLCSLDDLDVSHNQLTCELPSTNSLQMQLLVVGGTSRVAGNRLKETRGTVTVSGVTLGAYQTTIANQSTHCLSVRGLLAVVDQMNLIQVAAGDCAPRLSKILNNLKGSP